MISMTPITSAGGTAKYHTEPSAAVEYYADQKVQSQWKGQGAEIQGLAGQEVTARDLTQQLEGKVTEFSNETGQFEDKELGRWKVPKAKDGEVGKGGEIGKYEAGTKVKFGHFGSEKNSVSVDGPNVSRNQQGTVVSMKDSIVTVKLDDGRTATVDTDKYVNLQAWEHRCGWDLTFAPSKSVSLESELFGKDDVRAAHEYAVAKAMEWLEEKAAQTRVDGEFVKTGNLTYATFEHATSREGDPHTHTHVIISNVTYIDGKAYSLSNEKLMDYRATADQVYKNELASELVKLGYEIEWDKKGDFEIVGYSRSGLETFSKRNEQMKGSLSARGLDKDTASHSARQAANLDTRKDKNHPESALAHRGKWEQEAEAAGVKSAERHPVKEPRTHEQEMQSARDAVASAINHLTEREQAFSDRDLWKEAAKFAQGQTDTDKIASAIGELKRTGDLIERADGKFTTREAVEGEKWMAEHLSKGQGAHEAVMNGQEFEAALKSFEERKSFHLSEEQRDASRMILVGDDRYQGVQGLAGTGKTTMLEFVREAAESKGWEIKGFSNGGAQADKMQEESGIKSSTTARHLIDSDRVAKDAALAEKAIATYEKNDTVFGQKPDWNNLNKQVKNGEAVREFDSEKRMFITDKSGNTWTPDLYNKVTEIEAKNFEHLGLTETKYAVTSAGVFKTGGNLMNEAAGAIKESFNEHLSGKAGDVNWVVNKVLSNYEGWQKCNIAEATVVRGLCERESSKLHDAELGSLKDQVALADGSHSKTLLICDEASMSGQREFNRVIESTEQAGARTVFLGDENQHQAVEAGKGFELAQDHMPMAELGRDSIRRQTTEHAKEAVGTILDGKHEEAMAGLNTKEISTHQDAVREKYEGRDDLNRSEKAEMRAEMKDAAQADNKEVIREIAKDYTSMDREDRDKTLVITATNQDRSSINNEIRDNLKAQGELRNGKTMDTLEKTGLTKEEASRAINYEKGQVVEFGSNYKTLGVEKGDQITVTHVDNRSNTVFGKTEDGKEVAFNPEKIQNKELYEKNEGKEFAVGDRVAFTKNDRDLDVKNGQIGTVEKFDGKEMTVRMENGENRQFDVKEYQHLDHAYAMTSYKSQGQTYDNVMIHHNTDAGQHGDRETYVNVTRAREDVTVYTQDADKASKQSGQEMNKESATTKEADRETHSEKAPQREAEQPSQPALSSAYENAIQHVDQQLPEIVVKASPEQITERDLANALDISGGERDNAKAIQEIDRTGAIQSDYIKAVESFEKSIPDPVQSAQASTNEQAVERVEPGLDAEKYAEANIEKGLDVAGAIQLNERAIQEIDQTGAIQSDYSNAVESFEKSLSEPVQNIPASSLSPDHELMKAEASLEKGLGIEDGVKAHEAAILEIENDGAVQSDYSKSVESFERSISEPANASEAVAGQGGKDLTDDRGAESHSEPQQSKEAGPAMDRDAVSEPTAEAIKDQPTYEAVAEAGSVQGKAQDDRQTSQPEQQQSSSAEQVSEPARTSEAVSEHGGKDVGGDRGVEPQQTKEAETIKDQPATEAVAEQGAERETEPQQSREAEPTSERSAESATQESGKDQPAAEVSATQEKSDERVSDAIQSTDKGEGREPVQSAEVDASVAGKQGFDASAEQSQSSSYVEQRLESWLKEVAGVSDKSASADQDKSQNQDGAENQISGSVKAKDSSGQEVKDEASKSSEKKEEKAEAKSEKKEAAKVQERDMDFGR